MRYIPDIKTRGDKYERHGFSRVFLQDGKQNDMLASLAEALPDTRAFNGCISVETYAEQNGSSILLVEEWESKAHQEAYLEWRVSTGLLDAIAPLVSADPLFRSYEIRSE